MLFYFYLLTYQFLYIIHTPSIFFLVQTYMYIYVLIKIYLSKNIFYSNMTTVPILEILTSEETQEGSRDMITFSEKMWKNKNFYLQVQGLKTYHRSPAHSTCKNNTLQNIDANYHNCLLTYQSWGYTDLSQGRSRYCVPS